ncbi:hypothetical protein CVT24_011698 [Panaeolus cyanescens]|uniref:Raptor N-terminal CASPase-like domain-containing protein n=1 Tax=Panaeolus cyanescens TaxID=181874 RepID=A0A409YHA6_9AGAR|nr:hypothetical protein CVT24_011698 [Panaeolus cyanescens]
MQSTQYHNHHQQHRQSGPNFTPGPGTWSTTERDPGRRARGSDSDTERDYRSNSRSDPSSVSQTRNRLSQRSPEGRGSNSVETTPEPAPPIPYWSAKRHLTCGNSSPDPAYSSKNIAWRGSAPGKLKTGTAALVVCLNIDVDPPDVVKTNPCAVLECWVDPHTMPSVKALEAIGSNLQHQFEGLSLKIPYKPVLDPSLDELRRSCQNLRKQAKDDAVLFYYNGHGVPKPTSSGELWCFNRNYTQYIPVSLQELQSWLGSPGVYIWDCSAAGYLLQNFLQFAKRRDEDFILGGGAFSESSQPMMNSLQLAACAAHEQLPSCPELPADVFTSCLTSPIDIALRYFIMNHQLPNNITADMVVQLPGDLKDRRTPLGELNWIFTAITDTIAWTTFSKETFTRLYRCDLLIASLFRNFLLAERIMKNYHCTPHTYPPLPATNTHPLWATWDLAVDACLRQLPELLAKSTTTIPTGNGGAIPGRIGSNTHSGMNQQGTSDKPYTYVPSRFFQDQLTAFEVWIARGGSALTRRGPLSQPQSLTNGDASSTSEHQTANPQPIQPVSSDGDLVPRKPPDQLPIVLQVLLSQPHRLRALILLSQFVDLGPWAVHLVLTIGIFPYISKLLQAAGQDLRPVLIFIWARILAVDSSVQTDLYNTQGYRYFSNVLALRNEDTLPNVSEHKAMCSFILASICRDFPAGQMACLGERVFQNCYDRLEEPDFLLRQWTALCIAQMWDGNDEIKIFGVDRGTQDRLINMLSDDSAEVRCAALYALGTFMGASGSADPNKRGGGGTGAMFTGQRYPLTERVHFRMEVAVVTGATLAIKDDASPMCRKELLVLISCLVKEWRGYFVVCAWIYWEEDRRWRSGTGGHHVHPHTLPYSNFNDDDITNQAVAEWLDQLPDDESREENRVLLTSFFTIFVVLLDFSVDPYQEVATNAQTIIDYIMALLLESPFTRLESTTLNSSPGVSLDRKGSPQLSVRSRVTSLQSSPKFANQPPLSPGGLDKPPLIRSETLPNAVTNTIKRTSSFANALKALTGSIAFPGTSSTTETATASGRASPALTLPGILGGHVKQEVQRDISRPPSPNMNFAQYSSPYSVSPPHSNGSHSTERERSQERSSSRGSSASSRTPEPLPPVDFLPCDVMEALMEEDMERLRARRRNGGHMRRHPSHHSAIHMAGSGMPSPSNSTFSMDSNSSVILGLGTGSGIRDALPLKSNYFDWCAEYFKEPQMRQTEADEPGSIQYNYQVWRQTRNETVLMETAAQSNAAENTKWDRPVATFSMSGYPLTMAFHSYDPHLFVANESDMISVWDWQQRKRINYFCNGNPKGTSITSLQIINQDVGGIILTGSADGVVRLYRNYDPNVDQSRLQMVSAFRGLTEQVQSRQGTGVILDWKQSAGILLVGGDSRVIKVWDAQTETQGLDADTNCDSPVTAITSDVGASQTFLASFADGSVRVFDRRMEEEDSIVRTYQAHKSWVQNVRWHPKLSAQFLSASVDGTVKLFDLRSSDRAVQKWNSQSSGLASFDVHAISGVFASSSIINPAYWRSQRVVVQSLSKEQPLSAYNVSTGLTAPYIRGMPSSTIPRLGSLVFHPTEMLYGMGGPDGMVRIMGAKLTSA